MTITNRSAFFKKIHANRTPEQKKVISKKTSDSIKAWHAEMSPEKRQEINRKISASMVKRSSEIPPRHKKDISKKKSESFRKFDNSPQGKIHREYLGYLSSQDILNCAPERKKKIIQRRRKGQQRYWATLSLNAKKTRLKKLARIRKERKEVKSLFFEEDVPRK